MLNRCSKVCSARMGVGWDAILIPVDESFVPEAGTAERFIGELCSTLGLGIVRNQDFYADDTPPDDEGAEILYLQPPDKPFPIAEFNGSSGKEYSRLVVRVLQTPAPQPAFNPYGGLRICGHCGVTVPDMAECSSCHKEEDGSVWQMAPPALLFTAALETTIAFNWPPDLATKPLTEVEAQVRQYFAGLVERWEQQLGIRFRLVVMAT